MQVTVTFRRKGCWSQKYDQCCVCKTTEKKHFAHGLCVYCYGRAYRDAQKMMKEDESFIKALKDANIDTGRGVSKKKKSSKT